MIIKGESLGFELSQKNGPSKTVQPEKKMIRLDHFWSPKFGPAGPNLAAKTVWADQKWSGLENR